MRTLVNQIFRARFASLIDFLSALQITFSRADVASVRCADAQILDETVTRLNVILERLEKGAGTAGKLMVDPSLYNSADATLASTHELVEALRDELGLTAPQP